MKKYIDCDEAVKFIKGRYSGFVENILTTLIEEEVPAADVRENVHAEWVDEGYRCSNCGWSLGDIMDSDSFFAIGFDGCCFCPWCGADMGRRIMYK